LEVSLVRTVKYNHHCHNDDDDKQGYVDCVRKTYNIYGEEIN